MLREDPASDDTAFEYGAGAWGTVILLCACRSSSCSDWIILRDLTGLVSLVPDFELQAAEQEGASWSFSSGFPSKYSFRDTFIPNCFLGGFDPLAEEVVLLFGSGGFL